MNNRFFKQLEDIASCGVDVRLLGNSEFRIGGFYKSDFVDVDLNKFTITSRYDRVTPFEEWEDLRVVLLWLNEEWWESSKERFDGWKNFDSNWRKVELLMKEITGGNNG